MRRFYLAWIVCFAITASRDLDALAKPILWVEDGLAIWTHYYNLTTIIPPVRYWAGYVSLGSDIIGYIVSYFPTRWQPHMLPSFAMIVSSAAFALFATPPFRRFVENDNQRLAVAIGLGALPLGDFAAIGLVGYTQWPMGFVLCLLVLLEPDLSLRTAKGFGLLLLMTVAAWTNPVSVLLLPFIAYEIWRQRAEPWSACGYLLLFVVGVLYVLVGRTYAPTTIHVVKGAVDGTRLILERGVLESAFGTTARVWILGAGPWWASAAGLATAAVTLAALRDRLADRTFLFFVLKSALVGAAICYLSAMLRDDVGLSGEWGRRYAFIPGALFALIFLIAVTDTIARLAAASRAVASVAAIAAVVWINQQNLFLYKSPSEFWPRFHGFLKEIVAAEKAGQLVTLRLEGQEREGWPLIVKVRPR